MMTNNKNKIRKRILEPFATDIKGFENEYFFLKDLYAENNWSKSAIQRVFRRLVEGWRYDGLDKQEHTPESLDLENKIRTIRSLKTDCQSLLFFTTTYGENLGKKKFAENQELQAYTNSKEYKGMTDEEFKAYNLSRAVTLENMVKKYGLEKGTEVFEEYRQKQIYTKSRQRYIDEFGEEKGLRILEEINKKKHPCLENFQRLYGEDEGWERFKEFQENQRGFFSEMASGLFRQIEKELNIKELTYIYEPKATELCLSGNGRNFYYDFCIPELKFIIEFNGDLFHGNPKLFRETDHPNPFNESQSVKEMWEKDKTKLDLARNKGYTVLVIWESEYKHNRKKTINNVVKEIRRLYETDRNRKF